MTVHNAGRFFVSAAATVALLGGCGGGSPAGMPEGTAQQLLANPRSLVSDAGARAGNDVSNFGGWMYTAQFFGHDVQVYQRNGFSLTPFETITNGISAPQGTMTTRNGWWYVANGGHSNVLIFRSTKHGPAGPVGTLDDFGYVPVNVAVNPSRRLVAVSNGASTSGGTGSVSVYLNRQTEPSRILTYGNGVLHGMGIAIDKHGNCYWSFNTTSSGNGSVVEFSGCDGPGAIVVPSIANAGGVAFDQQGNLYYVDQASGVYKCKGTASPCKLFASGFGDPININFDYKSKNLWIADATGYIDAVKTKNGRLVYHEPAAGGPTDPPFGIAPAPGI